MARILFILYKCGGVHIDLDLGLNLWGTIEETLPQPSSRNVDGKPFWWSVRMKHPKRWTPWIDIPNLCGLGAIDIPINGDILALIIEDPPQKFVYPWIDISLYIIYIYIPIYHH